MDEQPCDNEIFIVGKHMAYVGNNIIWDIIGVFDDRKKAEDACINKTYFIGPMPGMNISVGDDRKIWPGSYFPKRKEVLTL